MKLRNPLFVPADSDPVLKGRRGRRDGLTEAIVCGVPGGFLPGDRHVDAGRSRAGRGLWVRPRFER